MHLKSDEHLNKVFPEKPVIAYRRAPTLRDMLVKSNLKAHLVRTSQTAWILSLSQTQLYYLLSFGRVHHILRTSHRNQS